MTAADLVNQASEGELETIFRDYGEERQARRIARAIVRARGRRSPSTTTGELQRLIDRGQGARGRRREERIDPATRVFQALRIAVNQELAGLERFIERGGAACWRPTAGWWSSPTTAWRTGSSRTPCATWRAGEVDPVTGRPRSESQLIEVLTRKPVRPSGGARWTFNPALALRASCARPGGSEAVAERLCLHAAGGQHLSRARARPAPRARAGAGPAGRALPRRRAAGVHLDPPGGDRAPATASTSWSASSPS